MSLWIPRLEWDDQIVTATRTSTSPILASISSTAEINVGMIASGTGVPTDAVVISKTANSVTLSADATLSGTSSVTFFERYDFEFPPTKDTEFVRKPKNTVTASLSGKQQVQTLHLEGERDLEFWFINQTDADKLRDNWYLFAYKGYEFRYYPDKDEVSVFTVELNKYDFKRIRQVKKHPNFKYSLGFSIRYVVE